MITVPLDALKQAVEDKLANAQFIDRNATSTSFLGLVVEAINELPSSVEASEAAPAPPPALPRQEEIPDTMLQHIEEVILRHITDNEGAHNDEVGVNAGHVVSDLLAGGWKIFPPEA